MGIEYKNSKDTDEEVTAFLPMMAQGTSDGFTFDNDTIKFKDVKGLDYMVVGGSKTSEC